MDDLKTRGFGCEIGYGKNPALLVIDMMKAFTNPSMPLGANQDDEVRAINQLLEPAHEKGVPVYFTIISYDDRSLADAGVWFHKMKGLNTLRAGTEAIEIDSRLERSENDTVLIKKYASAFFGTDLVSRLNYRNIDTLILTGCTTSGCIRATAVDAIQFGYKPIVVADAVTDRLVEAHRQSLFDLQLKYADVKNLKEVIAYLAGGMKNE